MKRREGVQTHTIVGVAASLLVTIIVAGINYKNPQTFTNPRFWSLSIATLAFVFLLEQYIAIKFFTPELPMRSPVATEISITDNIALATHNLCSMSSNWLGFWLNETYVYYLHLNVAKSLQSLTKQDRSYLEELSKDSTACIQFYERGLALADDIAHSRPQSQFFSLRFLVYSAAEYGIHAEEVLNLIHAQALGGIHCVPLVREELKAAMSANEWNTLTYLTRDVCHQTFRLKIEPRSRATKLNDMLTREGRADFLMPDALIINNNDVIPANDTYSPAQAWWHDEERQRLCTSEQRHDLEMFKAAFRILCAHAKECLWERYTFRCIKLVPIVHNSATTPTASSP
jgi:hypothetical protein